MLMNQLFKKTATVCMALLLLVGLAFPVYAGVTVFDSNQSGNKVLSPRGYSVTAPVDGEEKELWLQSPFDHAYYDGINNKASVAQGSSDDSLEVESLDAGKYTFHLWIDKNPAGGALSGDISQYFAVYINDEETPKKLKELSGSPYEVVIGAAENSQIDPNGLEGQWSISFSMNVLEGESYRFVFLRGVQANNGNTTVLFDSAANGKEGYIGYINGDRVTAEEAAAYEKAKFDVYEYVSEKSELGKDANNYTVYALTLVPFEHVLKVNGGAEPEEPTPAEPEEPTPAEPEEPTPAEPEEPTPAEPEEPTPAEPEEPAPAEPEAPLNGIVKGKDGKWAMYKDDKVVTSYTGIAKNAYGWWRVENGYVNFNAQGIYRNEYGWWKTTDGKVTFDETGIFKNEYGWWRVEDSKVNFKAQEIYKNKYGWWKTTDGKVTFKENGVFRNDYGWWKVENSKVNFKFTGIASNKYGTWFVKDGKVDFHKNGKVKFEGKVYQVKDGRAKLA